MICQSLHAYPIGANYRTKDQPPGFDWLPAIPEELAITGAKAETYNWIERGMVVRVKLLSLVFTAACCQLSIHHKRRNGSSLFPWLSCLVASEDRSDPKAKNL